MDSKQNQIPGSSEPGEVGGSEQPAAEQGQAVRPRRDIASLTQASSSRALGHPQSAVIAPYVSHSPLEEDAFPYLRTMSGQALTDQKPVSGTVVLLYGHRRLTGLVSRLLVATADGEHSRAWGNHAFRDGRYRQPDPSVRQVVALRSLDLPGRSDGRDSVLREEARNLRSLLEGDNSATVFLSCGEELPDPLLADLLAPFRLVVLPLTRREFRPSQPSLKSLNFSLVEEAVLEERFRTLRQFSRAGWLSANGNEHFDLETALPTRARRLTEQWLAHLPLTA